MTTASKPMDEWQDIAWKKVERNVFKLQKRIYQASPAGEQLSPAQAGAHDKRSVVEEPCEGKLSRTVLKPSGGGDLVA